MEHYGGKELGKDENEDAIVCRGKISELLRSIWHHGRLFRCFGSGPVGSAIGGLTSVRSRLCGEVCALLIRIEEIVLTQIEQSVTKS